MMHSLEFRLGEGIQDCVKDEKSIWDTPTIYIDLSAIASELCSGTVVFGYKVRSQLECQLASKLVRNCPRVNEAFVGA